MTLQDDEPKTHFNEPRARGDCQRQRGRQRPQINQAVLRGQGEAGRLQGRGAGGVPPAIRT